MPTILARWRARCAHLLVDEAQDLDRAQLRLALLLAAPANRIFLVGDDDQSIYGWRLADVRRVLGLADALPGLRRVDLVVNYRCPATVVERAVRLVEHNRERFAKTIRARDEAPGPIVLAADASDEPVRIGRRAPAPLAGSTTARGRSWPGRTASSCRRSRVALEARASRSGRRRSSCSSTSPLVDACLVRRGRGRSRPAAARRGSSRPCAMGGPGDAGRRRRRSPVARDPGDPDATRRRTIAAAVLAWAAPVPTLDDAPRGDRGPPGRPRPALPRRRAADLRDRPRDEGPRVRPRRGDRPGRAAASRARARSPTRPSPARALEEERRLAYVAWTRARRSLTLVYDPGHPSSFLLEAFDPDELGSSGTAMRAA